MLDKLGERLRGILRKLATAVFMDDQLIESVSSELKRSLLEADVEPALVAELLEKIKREAKKPIPGLDKKEAIIKLIHDELTEMVGKETKLEIEKKKPFKIMLLGLYGCGKTTTAAKLAFYFSKRGFKPCVVGLDTHRPAAPEQLEQLAVKARIAHFIDKEEKLPGRIWKKFEEKLKSYDIAIIDTAGRDVLSKALINELKALYREIKPDQVWLVMPADLGKTAGKQAKGFAQVCEIDGIILSRLDGTAKGGGALAACSEVKAPVLFVGTGEKLEDIERFDPSDFVSRLLGMGSLKALIEKARLALEEKEQKKIKERLEEGKFTLNDLYEQIKAMQKMGPLSKLVSFIPGLGGMTERLRAKMPNMFEVQEEKLKRWKYAIDSMTKEERETPEILNASRIARISKGSAVSAAEIRELLKQYKLMKDLITGSSLKGLKGLKGFDQRLLQQLSRKFGRF